MKCLMATICTLLLAGTLYAQEERVLEARWTHTPPKIDGRIEDLWKEADSVTGFTQLTPYEGEPATEPTFVWLLYDDANLYVACKCETPGRKPVARLAGTGDGITLYLDTFHNKTTAYFFSVEASGTYEDGIVLNDGRNLDFSWDGVWFQSAKVHTWGYVVEMKIPFKSIRYRKGLFTWGINIERFIYSNQGWVHWAPLTQKEWLRISRSGELRGINPGVVGRHIEVYPVGFLRHEKYEGETSTHPFAGIDFSWGITPEITLVSTVNPDFCEIEADPYKLNLSKYETYFEERRPFFVAGSEHFKPARFYGGFYKPIQPLYSREIGKRLPNGETVPILFGLKAFGKSERWDLGALLVKTEKEGDEPSAYFNAFKYSHQILENSSIGFMYSGKEYKDGHTRIFDIDGALRTKRTQLLYQLVGTNVGDKNGIALSSGLEGKSKGLYYFGKAQWASDEFDISDVGYAKLLPGETDMFFGIGPQKYYKKGMLSSFNYGLRVNTNRYPDEEKWSYGVRLFSGMGFRNGWGGGFDIGVGKSYEADTSYNSKTLSLFAYPSEGPRLKITPGFRYSYKWNYYREWLGWCGSNWLSVSYSLTPKISISSDGYAWVEFQPGGSLEAITWRATPRVELNLTKDISFNLYSEFVPITSDSNTELSSNRTGLLFSWRVAPKSWVYAAVNTYSERGEDGSFSETERIGVIKIKYLWYF